LALTAVRSLALVGPRNVLGRFAAGAKFWTSTAAVISAALAVAVATVAAPDALAVGRSAGDAVARVGVERSFLLFTHASRRNFSQALLFSLGWLPCSGWDFSVTVAAV
jgi:hypothetical protein